MPLHIRAATSDDTPFLTELIGFLGYTLTVDQILGRMEEYSSDHSRVLVAVLEGKMTGFLSFYAAPMFHEAARLGRITAMVVHPQFHRQGVGKALVGAAENFALQCDCARIEVTSGDHREQDAHRFYQALGYHVDCRRFLKRFVVETK